MVQKSERRPIMPLGRPRAFDADAALDRALEVFWQKGYEGAALSDLTSAMGINRPSLYAAFGNKETLFKKVVERYAGGPAAYTLAALEEPTARAVVERMLRGVIEATTNPATPAGCLMVQAALAAGDEADPVRRELAARRTAVVVALQRRLERARAEDDLSAGADPAALAQYVVVVIQGIAVQAASGASREALELAAEVALHAWPS
jgi:AcrR family transcriptional regulator